jgi:REP element-mobilizing transposase RayT
VDDAANLRHNKWECKYHVVFMMIAIPPKYAIFQVVEYIKGRSVTRSL